MTAAKFLQIRVEHSNGFLKKDDLPLKGRRHLTDRQPFDHAAARLSKKPRELENEEAA
jgi:hypothetical protein